MRAGAGTARVHSEGWAVVLNLVVECASRTVEEKTESARAVVVAAAAVDLAVAEEVEEADRTAGVGHIEDKTADVAETASTGVGKSPTLAH